MTKYRIVKSISSDRKEIYYVEYKKYFFWFRCKVMNVVGTIYDKSFTNIEDAKTYIDEDIAIDESLKRMKKNAEDFSPIYYP